MKYSIAYRNLHCVRLEAVLKHTEGTTILGSAARAVAALGLSDDASVCSVRA